MSKKNQLRVKFAFKEGTKFSASVQEKIELICYDLIVQLSTYSASRGVAFPHSVEVNLPGGRSVVFKRPKAEAQTKRQKEILREAGTLMLLDFLETIARDEPESAMMKKRGDAYKKAFFGKLRSSEKKRAAFEFLRLWRLSGEYDRESTTANVMCAVLPMQIAYLSPLLEALNDLDAEFFDGLAEAMRILRSYGKDPTNKWLIEHEEEIRDYTPDEIKKRFGAQFQAISEEKLHERLNNLGLDQRHKPSGKASPNYRQFRQGG